MSLLRFLMDPGASPVSADQVAFRLAADWGISPVTVLPTNSGHSGSAWTFRASSPGGSYFVKVKRGFSDPGPAVALLLAGRGLPVVAPLLTAAGSAWVAVANYFLFVSPWIPARPMPSSPSPAEWRGLGRALRSIHRTVPNRALQMRLQRLSFVPWGSKFLPKLDQACSAPDLHADPCAKELTTLWKAQGALPAEIFELLQEMGRSASATTPEFCLCHGDFQPDNVIWTEDGAIHIVDWDSPSWAPVERDLMFVPPLHRTSFLQGYGPHHANGPVMSYLWLDWLLQEALDCANRILFVDAAPAEEKEWALDLLRSILPKLKTALSTARP